jgi:hypothetical protein
VLEAKKTVDIKVFVIPQSTIYHVGGVELYPIIIHASYS